MTSLTNKDSKVAITTKKERAIKPTNNKAVICVVYNKNKMDKLANIKAPIIKDNNFIQ